MARPEPLAAVGAAAPAGSPGVTTAGIPDPAPAAAPSADEQFFAPAVLQPVVQAPSPPSRYAAGDAAMTSTRPEVQTIDLGRWIVGIGLALVVIAAAATAWFTFGPSAHAKPPAPVALAPRPPTEGLPTSLDAIVRIQAESTRHTALQTVEQIGSGDLEKLAATQPDYQWIAGTQTSTDSHVVSVAQNGATVVIAVAASNKDICAFGQWAPDVTPTYVTMAHEPKCMATAAPLDGWSTQAGGAASDLPDDNG